LVVPALPVLAGRPVPPGGTLTPPRQATTSAKGRSHQVGTGTTQPRSGPVPAASAATHVPPVAGAVGTQPRHTDVTLPKVGGQRLSQPVSQPSTGQTGFVPGRSQEVMRLRTPRST